MIHAAMTDISTTSVLRIGPVENNASAALLKTALQSHFKTVEDDDDGAPNTTLTVSNRYFHAKVLLEDLSSQHTQTTNPDTTKEDGIILVFDAMHSNPNVIGSSISPSSCFDALTMVHDKAEQDGECGDLLRLCVGVYVGEKTPTELRGKNHEEEYSRRVLWCLDRGYEYVEADASQKGQLSGHDERDKDGFARIVEAISGTVWSSAVMEKSKKQELKQSYDQEKESLATKQQEEEGENPYVPPDPSLLDSQIQSELVKDSADSTENYFIDDAKAAEQDRTMENLEGLLRQAASIREASRAGELTDEERRQRAADAATLMMSLMSQLDTEEDQEDFDVDSSSDEDGNC